MSEKLGIDNVLGTFSRSNQPAISGVALEEDNSGKPIFGCTVHRVRTID